MKKWLTVDTNIDLVLSKNSLFRLVAFSSTATDCLFHALHALFHFCYSSIELQHALVDKLIFFLHNGNIYALESFQYEFVLEFLYQLHDIHDVCTCLSKMQLSTSTNQPKNERGIWGGAFFLRCLANKINISIKVSSLTRKRRYLLFNRNACTYIYCILFHSSNPITNHCSIKYNPYEILEDLILTCPLYAKTFN
jgi:hypothetical protein